VFYLIRYIPRLVLNFVNAFSPPLILFRSFLTFIYAVSPSEAYDDYVRSLSFSNKSSCLTVLFVGTSVFPSHRQERFDLPPSSTLGIIDLYSGYLPHSPVTNYNSMSHFHTRSFSFR